MNRILFVLTVIAALFIAVGTTAAAGAPAPVASSAAMVPDPLQDVVGGNSIDLTAFSIVPSGRGLTYEFTFNGPAPAPSDKVKVCLVTGKGLACIVTGKQAVFFQRKSRPATITRGGNKIRLWVRAAYLGYQPGSGVQARAKVTLTTASDPCAATCVELTDIVKVGYVGVTACKAVGRKYLNGPRARKVVALTFDDGPGPYTDDVLNTLKSQQVPATFYINGINISTRHAPLLKRMRAEGHELANHSWAHENRPGATSMRRTNNRIRQVSGVQPCTFRPPFGDVNSTVVAAAASERMATILWDIDTNDWRSPGVGSIVRVGSSGTNGSIVLMHDGPANRPQTAATVSAIIRNYRARGFEFVTVDEVLGFVQR